MTLVKLTKFGKEFIVKHYPEGIIYEYDLDGDWELAWMTKGHAGIRYLGIPYKLPLYINDEVTFKAKEK